MWQFLLMNRLILLCNASLQKEGAIRPTLFITPQRSAQGCLVWPLLSQLCWLLMILNQKVIAFPGLKNIRSWSDLHRFPWRTYAYHGWFPKLSAWCQLAYNLAISCPKPVWVGSSSPLWVMSLRRRLNSLIDTENKQTEARGERFSGEWNKGIKKYWMVITK